MAATDTQRVTEEAYHRLALTEPDRKWELHDGRLREKPPMTFGHGHAFLELAFRLREQLDPEAFVIGANGGRVRRSGARVYIPDVFVVPTALPRPFRGRSDLLEVYGDPLPLVVEVWSPSTGDYDVNGKLAEYQARGDHEIWRLHPYERTLTVWRRQPDGTYEHGVYRGGVVRPTHLPNVAIDLDALFDSVA